MSSHIDASAPATTSSAAIATAKYVPSGKLLEIFNNMTLPNDQK